MQWIIESLIAAMAGGSYTSVLKLVNDNYVGNSAIFTILLSCFSWFYIKNKQLNISKYLEKWSIISGITFGITTIFVNKSIVNVSNPGVPISLVPAQVLLTYFLSLSIFKEKFSITKFIPIMIILIGSIITVLPDLINFKNTNILWIIYISIAIFFVSISDITSKLALNKITNVQYQVVSLLAATIVAGLIQLTENNSLGLKKLPKDKVKNISKYEILDKYDILTLIFAIFCMINFQYHFAEAVKGTKNPAYPRGIINSQFIPAMLISKLIIKDSTITGYQYLGSFITLLGIMYNTIYK